MKIVLELRDTEIMIVRKDITEPNIIEVRDGLLIPALLSAGYHPDNINELFGL
jgi:hypothetical protein